MRLTVITSPVLVDHCFSSPCPTSFRQPTMARSSQPSSSYLCYNLDIERRRCNSVGLYGRRRPHTEISCIAGCVVSCCSLCFGSTSPRKSRKRKSLQSLEVCHIVCLPYPVIFSGAKLVIACTAQFVPASFFRKTDVVKKELSHRILK